MKKAKYIILLSLTVLLTGCVKSNTSMTINKDKSMSITSEVLISDKLLDNESKLIIKDEKDKLQKKNMTVEEIKNSNGYSGFSVTKRYDNIDKNSKEEYKEIIISNFFDDKFDDSVLFQVKKGLFKNVYTANYKFEVDNDDFVENNSSEETIIDDTTNTPTVENDAANAIDNTNSVDNNTGKDTSSGADLVKLASEMEFKYSVNLPYKVLESNATKKSDDGKKLEWDLNSNDAVMINYSFELYNMNNIYMAIGISIGTIILLIILIVVKNKIVQKKREKISSKPILKEYDPSIEEELLGKTNVDNYENSISNVNVNPSVNSESENIPEKLEQTQIINIPDDIK